ncbi:MAG: bifunctional phosphoribosylaminoimidazolecarboxamide formyltransferase/IMP cyclohydrolase [Betaproteobacteria bacterium TMED156]|nr:MAG: bifunctional phosphoribosylaminoimidazolecarboxamide formyltransferase/IMP cyclohydrolase [Betaproteobacteria bacterium TMED156]
MKINTCLISVYDKTNILSFAKFLKSYNIQIVSTGGTADILKNNKIEVTLVDEITNFPEILDGRVKTLHPSIHGGLLAKRNNQTHMKTIEDHNIKPIDMLVTNLYPFREKRKQSNSTDEIIENIDIGGSTLLRAAAKNFNDVLVVTDPNDYSMIISLIKKNQISLELRIAQATKAFDSSWRYEREISNFFNVMNKKYFTNNKHSKSDLNSTFLEKSLFSINFKKYSKLRYGENPHQNAAIYHDEKTEGKELICSNQIQGKELSFNNIVDADTASQCVEMFMNPACVIVKHANPCGVAEAESCLDAFQRAKLTDVISSFGSVIAFNKLVDQELAKLISEQFIELIIAPEFTKGALKMFSKRENLRVIKKQNSNAISDNNLEIKTIKGGYLVQTSDYYKSNTLDLSFVTKIKPSEKELSDLKFAWHVSNWVKSNAIVFCRDYRTLGIGAGQMSRLDSVKIAKIKAQQAGLSLENSVVASDAFFPFRDGVDVLSDVGAKSVIQPGGSIKDSEIIKAADEHNISMVFTSIRHFRH